MVSCGVAVRPASAQGATGPLAIVSNEMTATFGTPAPLRFPTDDAAHDGNFVEWWQWWLHLQDSRGKRYDAVVVFYQFPFSPAEHKTGAWLRRTDLRITDVANRSVRAFSTWSYENPYPTLPNRFDLRSLGQSATGSGGNDSLKLSFEGVELNLRTVGNQPAIPISADNGLNRVDALEALQIYERWRMPASGTLKVDGRERGVTGTKLVRTRMGQRRVTASYPVGLLSART